MQSRIARVKSFEQLVRLVPFRTVGDFSLNVYFADVLKARTEINIQRIYMYRPTVCLEPREIITFCLKTLFRLENTLTFEMALTVKVNPMRN